MAAALCSTSLRVTLGQHIATATSQLQTKFERIPHATIDLMAHVNIV
jgi:hypothetical protein